MTGLTLILAGVLLAGQGNQQNRSSVQQALDRPINLDVQDATLGAALQKIATESNVAITVSDETLSLLPYGDRTKISAQMHNVSLREGLNKLTAGIGLRYDARDSGIEILPTAPLIRLGRTATWETLETLAELKSTQFSTGVSALERWESRFQFRVQIQDPWQSLRTAISQAGAGPGDEILTAACNTLGWTWYPEKQHIVVLNQEDQLRRQLDKTVTLKESHTKIVDVMEKVGRQVGVNVRTEPGVIAALLPQIRSDFRLHVENVSAAYAFELIASAAGLGYRLDKEGVVFYQPSASAPASMQDSSTSPPRSPFVAKMILPPDENGMVIEIIIRESDLSPDVNLLRKKLLKKADEAIRTALEALPETQEQ